MRFHALKETRVEANSCHLIDDVMHGSSLTQPDVYRFNSQIITTQTIRSYRHFREKRPTSKGVAVGRQQQLLKHGQLFPSLSLCLRTLRA